MSGYYLYKYVVDDEIIYIGKSKNIHQRIAQHNSGTGLDEKFKPYLKDCKIFVAECVNSVEMDLMERALINQYKPILNVTDKFDGFSQLISLQEPAWEKWKKKYDNLKPKKVQKKKPASNISREEKIKRRLRYFSEETHDEDDFYRKQDWLMFVLFHIIFNIKAEQCKEKDGFYYMPCYLVGFTVFDVPPKFYSEKYDCVAELSFSVVKDDNYKIPLYKVCKNFLNKTQTKNYLKCLKQTEFWEYGGEWQYSCLQEAIKRTLETEPGQPVNFTNLIESC